MSDLRMFVSVDHNNVVTWNGPYDFHNMGDAETAPDRDIYYDELDIAEGSGLDVIELIKRPNGKWEHIGPHMDDHENLYKTVVQKAEGLMRTAHHDPKILFAAVVPDWWNALHHALVEVRRL